MHRANISMEDQILENGLEQVYSIPNPKAQHTELLESDPEDEHDDKEPAEKEGAD